MRFRPCIDLHQGIVKQIVGGTLRDGSEPAANFVSERPPSYYAKLYLNDNLTGGHVIMLGPGNEGAAQDALSAWPGGFQIGGGINPSNAKRWLDLGASGVIVTSYVFRDGLVDHAHLDRIVRTVGKERLILDLSCRKSGDRYWVATNRWQMLTEVDISEKNLNWLAGKCAEFLIHAADVEGLRGGIDCELVQKLADWASIPTTYAGGVRNLDDLDLVRELGQGRLDVTVGSALDIFGGELSYKEVVALNREWRDLK